jgi:hypothetical protein
MLYKVTVKSNLNSNGIRSGKGISVEVASQSYSLLSTLQGQNLVNNTFKVKYGVDVKKACAFQSIYLDVVKNQLKAFRYGTCFF